MALFWGFSFRVNDTQDFESRYSEVKATQNIPGVCEPDVDKAHDMAVAQINDLELAKPYAVFLSGSRDYATDGDCVITVQVQPSP